MSDGMVKIILALIGLLGTIVTTVVVPYIRSKTTSEQRDNAYQIVKIVVSAADQMLKIEDPSGQKRKEYVVDKLEKIGVKLDVKTLDLFIEAAVAELNLVQKSALN